ncbi:MAG: hypothetical protein IT225_05700 [Flavobacteriales bacterium]|jgi:hypothetical protein|nr:hypothetical protein [Flavobacteriales bacterium]
MRYTITLFLVGCFLTSTAQTTEEKADKISLFVGVVPGTNGSLTTAQQERLRDRIMQCANRTGIVTVGMSNFLLHPQMDINEVKTVEGMKRITVAKCEVALSIARTDHKNYPGQSFGTMSLVVTGSGADSAAALSNAIQQIRTDDPRIGSFITETKARILDYYTQHCDEVVKEARRHYELQQHHLSIGLLFSVPTSAPCYDEARKLSINVYKEYLKDECEQQLLQLKAALVATKGSDRAGRHAEALRLVKEMNPAADCYQEAYGMMNKLDAELDEAQRREWNLQRAIVDNQAEVQKEAYKAMAAMQTTANPMQVIAIQTR